MGKFPLNHQHRLRRSRQCRRNLGHGYLIHLHMRYLCLCYLLKPNLNIHNFSDSDYHKLNQVVISVAATVPNMVPCWNKSTHILTPSMQMENDYFSTPIIKDHQNQFAFGWQSSNAPSLSFFRAISALQTYVIIYSAGTSSPLHSTEHHTESLH